MEQQTLRKAYPTSGERSLPEVAIMFPAVHSHRERLRPEKDSCQSFSSNSCSRVPYDGMGPCWKEPAAR